MNKMTVEKALAIRKALRSNKYTREQMHIFGNILAGEYDKYKDDAACEANEDLEFLRDQRLSFSAVSENIK